MVRFLRDETFVYQWKTFFENGYKSELETIALAYPSKKSLYVDYLKLDRYDQEMANQLLNNPYKSLFNAEQAIEEIDTTSEYKLKLHVRLKNLTGAEKIPIRNKSAVHLGKLRTIEGVVRKQTDVKMKALIAAFQCSKCGAIIRVEQTEDILKEPSECYESEGGCGRASSFKFSPNLSVLVDCMKIQVQECTDDLSGQSQPKNLSVYLEDDLINPTSLTLGDRISVTGVFHIVPKYRGSKQLSTSDFSFEALSYDVKETSYHTIEITDEDVAEIQKNSKDPLIYDKLIQSVAPAIYGLDVEKEAIILQLFGCQRIKMPDGTMVRGDSHILFIGDPGCAKSQLLRRATKLAPKGIFTTGTSSTAAGLTAAAVRDEFSEGQWSLEAGALVLADMGIACIEENQKVITENGITSIKDLKIGEKTLCIDNNFYKIKHHVDKGFKKTLKIELYDGNTIECTSDHKVLTAEGWKQSKNLTKKDFLVIPSTYKNIDIKNKNLFEKGIIHGFALSDIYFNEKSKKNFLSFSASVKNNRRTKKINFLLKKQYHVKANIRVRPATTRLMKEKSKEKLAKFSDVHAVCFSSKILKDSFKDLFENNIFSSNHQDFKLGFLTGILSTDCCIRHGIKHIIEISLNRGKYSDQWIKEKNQLVSTLFQSFGIFSVIRGNRILISSLLSYNRVVEIFGKYLIGEKKEKLYPVKSKKMIPSYDCLLNSEYSDWFSHIKFYTTKTVELGLHSSIYYAQKNHRTTIYLMEKLKEHWSEITNEPYRSPEKTYLLNKINKIESNTVKKVYDITIDGDPNFFIAGGIVHNCVDELDKMDEHDRNSLHTTMEQQIVAINKAGINTELHARCSILAAANPKLGSFDEFMPVHEQINLPSTLLSRFDLIFTVLDKPNTKVDSEKAEHVLRSRQNSEGYEPIKPIFSEEFIRKYIVYAKQNCSPVLSDDTLNKLKDFYVETRGSSDAGITITIRQLEALIRLSTASARIRLSDVVSVDDADRAIRIYSQYIGRVGTDWETGKPDIQKIAVGVSHSQQDRMKKILGVIKDLCDQEGHSVVDKSRILEETDIVGIDSGKVEEALDKLESQKIIHVVNGRYGVNN